MENDVTYEIKVKTSVNIKEIEERTNYLRTIVNQRVDDAVNSVLKTNSNTKPTRPEWLSVLDLIEPVKLSSYEKNPYCLEAVELRLFTEIIESRGYTIKHLCDVSCCRPIKVVSVGIVMTKNDIELLRLKKEKEVKED